jgi:acyl-CoA thioester hydrolase
MTVFSGGPSAPDSLTSRDFPVLWPVLTRWADNDMFGHLNNAVYYQLFDTAINGWINTNVELDPVTMPLQGIVAESGCRYFSELRFPEKLVVGLAITRLGRTSATYRLGVFRAAEQLDAVGVGSPAAGEGGGAPLGSGDPTHSRGTIAALGHWVHVYVDRISHKPAPIPDTIRALLSTACVG